MYNLQVPVIGKRIQRRARRPSKIRQRLHKLSLTYPTATRPMTMLPQLMLVNGHKINNHLVQIPNIRYEEKRKENKLDKSRAVVLRERAQDVVFGEREWEQFGNVAFGLVFFSFLFVGTYSVPLGRISCSSGLWRLCFRNFFLRRVSPNNTYV